MTFIPQAPNFAVLGGGVRPRCDHELMPQDDPRYMTIYPYRCAKCSAKYSECEIVNTDGVLTIRDFTVKRGKRSTRRRGF